MRSSKRVIDFSVFSEPGSVSPVDARRRCGIAREVSAYVPATRTGSLGRRNDRRQVAEVEVCKVSRRRVKLPFIIRNASVWNFGSGVVN